MKNIINLFIAVDYQYHCLFQGLWQTASWAVYEWRALLLTKQYMCGYYIIFQRGHGILWDIEIGIIFQLVIFSLLENNMSYFLVRKKNPHLWFQGHCSCSAHINIRQNRRHLSSVSVCSSWFMKLWHTRGRCIAWWFQSCAVPSASGSCVLPTPSPRELPPDVHGGVLTIKAFCSYIMCTVKHSGVLAPACLLQDTGFLVLTSECQKLCGYVAQGFSHMLEGFCQ